MVELQPGTYDVTVNEDNEQGMFTFTGTIVVQMGQGVRSYTIQLVKESVTVSGEATYNGQGISDLFVDFISDLTVDNNTAVDTDATTLSTGEYSVELMPGTYIIAIEEEVNESGTLFVYTYSDNIQVSLIDDPVSKDIILTREQQ